MLWDDFARVGAPAPPRAAVHGLSLGQDDFPPALWTALTRAGIRVEAVPDVCALLSALPETKPDVLIFAAAALGPVPEAALGQLPAGAPPAILVTSERNAPASAPRGTPFAELLGAEQDALGIYLMLRATLRRKRPHVMTDVLSFGTLALDQERFVLRLGTREAPLRMLEFRLLGAMLDAPRLVWNKAFLNRVVFGAAEVKPGRQFDTHISLARRRLREAMGADPIVAEHRLGYALSPVVAGVTDILPRGAAGG